SLRGPRRRGTWRSWPGPPRRRGWRRRRSGRRPGARWRGWSRSTGPWPRPPDGASGRRRPSRGRRGGARSPRGRGWGSRRGSWRRRGWGRRSPERLVALGLETLGQLGSAGFDDAAVDEDVHPVGGEVVEEALVVRDGEHAEIGPVRAHLLDPLGDDLQGVDV